MTLTVQHVLDEKGFFQASNRIDTMVKNNISLATAEAYDSATFFVCQRT